MKPLIFPQPLREGRLINRKNRFIMNVELDGQPLEAHCASTGRIGNLVLENMPCLLSASDNPKRKTAYTVEALSLDPLRKKRKRWFGINQNAANHYVGHFLTTNGFSKMLPAGTVRREVKLGDSRLDFLVDDTFLEVKMPLQKLNMAIPPHIKMYPEQPVSVTDRLTKHMDSLGQSLQEHQRAIMLICFVYDAPVFQPRPLPHLPEGGARVFEVAARNRSLGLEFWQVNFAIDPLGVSLLDYFPLKNL